MRWPTMATAAVRIGDPKLSTQTAQVGNVVTGSNLGYRDFVYLKDRHPRQALSGDAVIRTAEELKGSRDELRTAGWSNP